MHSVTSMIKTAVWSGAWKAALVLGATIGMFLLSVPLFSQSSTGRILGVVTDQSGGAIAGATVAVTNVQTGVVRNLTTDQAGEYIAPNLLPGTYAVRVTDTGFKAIERKDILLEIDKDIRVDLQLSPGEITQTVEVTGAVPLVDSSTVTLGGTLSNDTINDLPLNGRNFINLVSLRPGVAQYPGGGAWTQSGNGLRVEDVNWVIDGVDNNESIQGESVVNSPGTAGDSATILPIDAIQEFNIEENPKAEWGWKAGALVNVGLKSGTNSIHGTAYAFGREDAWDAKNYFNTGPQVPLNFEQWGGTAGGPIVKDKLFYFAGFEEQRYVVGNTNPITIPTPVAGGGSAVSIPDATAELATHGINQLNALSQKLLPFFGTTNSPTGSVVTAFPSTNKSDNVLAKIDYNLNPHHTLSGSYFLGNDNNVSQDDPFVTQPAFLTTFKIRTMFASGRWIWTPNSRWVNETRFGFVRYNRPVQSVDHAVPATKYGINTGVTDPAAFGMPSIILGGSQLGAFQVWPNLLGPDNNFDFLDQVSYLRGKHAFKFGGEVRYARMKSNARSEGRGKFIFGGNQAFPGSTALEDFLAGAPAVGFVVVGNPLRNYRNKSYAGFAQDDWRIKPRLTLNLGLRWEYTGPLTEANNLIANFVPGSRTGMVQVGRGISSAYNRDKTNFAPRFGVAWDISGNGTTVIRAGGGVFYELLQAAVFTDQVPTLQNAHTPGIAKIPTGAQLVLPNGSTIQGSGTIATAAFSFPGSALNWTLAGPVFPSSGAGLSCGSGGATGTPCPIFAVTRNFSTPYVGIWTATLQHAFSPSLSLEVAYIGNHGDNLSGVVDPNQLDPQSAGENTPTCQHCEASTNRPFGAQYPYLSFVNMVKNPYRSNYNGLQTTLTGRHFHNLSFVAGYTYSHALDDISYSAFNSLPQDSRNIAAQYGDADLDTRHRFTLTTTWDIPGKKGLGQILEGWQLNSIVTLAGSEPWWAFDTGHDISKTGELMDRWDFFGNPGDFTSGPTPLPYFPGTTNAACLAKARTIDGGAVGGPTSQSLVSFGCYAKGKSILIPPAIGTFGTMGRNVFRDSGFRNWDLSVFKIWKFKERLTAQFRAEFFNVLNHPNFGNPWTSVNGNGAGGTSDPSSTTNFGCGCFTPDQMATNPVLGSGSARDIQFGLKLIF
jgi:hypothetical protein